MATAGAGTWREIRETGRLGRFVLLCIGIWLHAADTLVTATAVPAIVADIGGVAYVAWTIALYQVGAIVAGAGTALLCRRVGSERVLRHAALLYAAGCALAALAPDMGVLLLARLVQGIGGGTLLSLSYVAVQESFAEHLWGRLFGVQALIWAGGSLLGPLLGGLFVELGWWRGVFWCFALQALLLWLLTLALAAARPPARAAGGRFPGLRMLLLATATLLIAQAGVGSSALGAAGLGLIGVALLWATARLDRVAADRLLPERLLEVRRPLGAGLLAVFALSFGTTGFWTYGPLLLTILFDTSPLTAGYLLAGEALAWSAATLAVASAPPAAGPALIRAGAMIAAAGAAGLAWAMPAGSFPGIVLCQILQGVGFGLCWPALIQRTVRCADDPEKVLAAAAPGTVQRIGYAVGAAAAGIAANLCGLAEGVSADAARIAAFWVFAAFVPALAVGLAGAWRFTARR